MVPRTHALHEQPSRITSPSFFGLASSAVGAVGSGCHTAWGELVEPDAPECIKVARVAFALNVRDQAVEPDGEGCHVVTSVRAGQFAFVDRSVDVYDE